MVGQILYFDRPGPRNTDEVVAAVAEAQWRLKIQHVVVASNSGNTAIKVHEALAEAGCTVVCVPEHAGFRGGDEPCMTPGQRQDVESRGMDVLVCAHALSGVGRSITNKFGGISHTEIIAYTLRMFGCEGLKVAVEVAVMAADAGLVPTDREIIAIGGSGGGADCAAVIQAAHMNNFFDLEIREILAKARARR